MANIDYYSVASDIAEQLSKFGYSDWKSRIQNAIAGGATSTEILMAIRWNLYEFKKSKLKIDKTTETQIDDLIADIDVALR